MQTAGGIADHHIRPARLGGGGRIEYHRRRIRALLMLDHIHAGTVRPHLKLFNGGGAEGIRRAQHHFFALLLHSCGKLADGGGLADPVDTDHQHHRWFGVQLQLLAAAEHLGHRFHQHIPDRVRIGFPAFLDLAAQLITDMGGSGSAGIRHDEDFLEFLEQLLVNFGEGTQHGVDRLHNGIAGLFESRADFAEKAHLVFSFPTAQPFFPVSFLKPLYKSHAPAVTDTAAAAAQACRQARRRSSDT